ncbi:MAG: triose-phosphate isomerase [Thermoplasmata archaeon]
MLPPRAEPPTLGRPLFLLNLKAYPTAIGPAAEKLARTLEELGQQTGVAVAVAPAAPDLGRVASAVAIPVIAQHVDALEAGAHTGFVPPEAVERAGGCGSLVNHSEHPLSTRVALETVRRLAARGLVPVVCAKDVRAAARLAVAKPQYLAVEPPELIGGKISVSTARPEVVSGAVEAVGRVSSATLVLCGAGVHDRRDVARAMELGSEGVLVASAVTRAGDPRAAIAELLAGY